MRRYFAAFAADEVEHRVHGIAKFLHEVGSSDCGASTDARSAVNEHVCVLTSLINELEGLVEVGTQVESLVVLSRHAEVANIVPREPKTRLSGYSQYGPNVGS